MAIVVSMAVTPGPVFFLFFGRQLAKIAIGVAVVFAGPLMVIDHLIVVPYVIIAVVRIVDSIVVVSTASHPQ
jgi:hypothetical protein